jgi:serine/threonine-protein kinase
MGEVYRARDTKLKREVAIKVIPEEFSRDADRVSRFQREAEVLASLNHPNIGAIYDLAEADDTRFLVLELIEGETLGDRIQRGPIPIQEALNIAQSICEALEAAHERGIIHRDLKPGNVKITPDGKVKVLDFGLAKAMENTPATTLLSNSPTMVSATIGGMILGTAAYMSPEQARGRAADQRSDIFAFGCVLYEMLAARRAFPGEEVSDVLASVLKTEPDFGLLPPQLNQRIRDTLRRCLQKNPKFRWHAIADVRLELEVAAANAEGLGGTQLSAVIPKPALWKRAIPVLIALVITAAVTGVVTWNLKPSPPPAQVARFPILLGEGQRFTGLRFGTQISISADGTQIVYEANHQLYHRALNDSEATPIPGTQTMQPLLSPVFSPDGRSIAYITARSGPNAGDSHIKMVPLAGGVPTTLFESAEFDSSLRWSDEGILFGGSKGIMRLSPNGGNPETVVAINNGSNDIASNPQLLPGGQALLFTLGRRRVDANHPRIVVQSLKSGRPQVLKDEATDARYLPTGHILYASGTSLFVAPFDARALKLTGDPVKVVEGVRRGTFAAVQYDVSSNGTLIYVPGPASTTAELMVPALLDREGIVEPLKLIARPYVFPRMSPDGKRLVIQINDGKQSNIWIYELGGSQALRQLTVGGSNRFPIWSADGTRVTFQSDREGDAGIFWQRADGRGEAERLTTTEAGVAHIPDSWSKAGELSFTAVKGSEGAVWIFSLKSKTSTVFAEAQSALIARSAFSPDGLWVAYQSNEGETGRNRVWVQPFPTGAKSPVVEGGQPFWSSDGAELFFNAGTGGLISKVKITTRPNFAFSDVIPVSQGELVNAASANFPRNADIAPDGKLIGLIDADTSKSGAPIAPQIQIVLNWLQELKQRVPLK